MERIGIPRFTNRDSFGIVNTEIDTKDVPLVRRVKRCKRLDASPIRPEDPLALLGLRSVDESTEDRPILCVFYFFGKKNAVV